MVKATEILLLDKQSRAKRLSPLAISGKEFMTHTQLSSTDPIQQRAVVHIHSNQLITNMPTYKTSCASSKVKGNKINVRLL